MTDTLREAVERLAADLVHADVPAWLRDRVQDILADHPAPAPDADLCGLCKQPATGLASIDTTRYCHGDEDASPTCYEVACWRETGRVSIPMDLDARPGLCACGQPGCSDGSDTLAERTFTREAEAARCGCGNPDAHDYAPPSVPAGSDTADEPVCCHTTHGGPINRDECHRCRVESPVPSPAPEDVWESMNDHALEHFDEDDTHLGKCILLTDLIVAGWKSPTEVAALVARTQERVAGEIERDILALRVDSSGPQMVRYNCAAIARAATKAVSDA